MLHSKVFQNKRTLFLLATILFVLIPLNVGAQLGKVMSDVILPSTTPLDWPTIKSSIKNRVIDHWGQGPVPYSPNENINYKIVSEYEEYGLTHIVIKYEVLPGSWDRGIMVLPKNFDKKKKYKAVLTIHGTNGVKGADGMLDSIGRPNRAYPIELAHREILTFSPDQYSFGESIKNIPRDSLVKEFNQKYPDWSIISGRCLLGFMRSLDVLDKLSYVDNSNGYGVMGNSLGGKSSMNLAAIEDRITVAVVSTGVSPNISNAYRTKRFQPEYWEDLVSSGDYPWEVNEVIALCAPKSMLFLEPINDPYNRYVDYTVEAFMRAAPVWKLLGKPENFSFLIHGDGHDTTEDVRNHAYNWLIGNLNK